MGFLEWDERYDTGIPEMDKQHQKWVSILNEFYSNVSNNFTEENIQNSFNTVVECTNFHFKEEEVFMASIGYPELKTQKYLHEILSLKMKEFQEKLANHEIAILCQIVLDLEHWFYEHLQEEDAKYGKYYRKMVSSN